jgi:hypothetical protein
VVTALSRPVEELGKNSAVHVNPPHFRENFPSPNLPKSAPLSRRSAVATNAALNPSRSRSPPPLCPRAAAVADVAAEASPRLPSPNSSASHALAAVTVLPLRLIPSLLPQPRPRSSHRWAFVISFCHLVISWTPPSWKDFWCTGENGAHHLDSRSLLKERDGIVRALFSRLCVLKKKRSPLGYLILVHMKGFFFPQF